MTTRTDILETANQIVNAERQDNYGSPEQNFGRIAAFWTAYKGVKFSMEDVAAMMGLVKIARIATTPDHIDSWVDLAGYAGCGGEVCMLPCERDENKGGQ